MKILRLVPVAVLLLTLSLGSWSRALAADPAAASQRGAAAGKAPAKPGGKNSTTTKLGRMPDARTPIEYESPDGRFQAVYPSGCARLFTRSNVVPDSVEATRIYIVNCDRAGVQHEGCSVIARIGALRNVQGQAAVNRVMEVVNAELKAYGAKPFKETPFRRDFGKHGICEGIDIRARKVDGPGDFWIRGMLHGDDAYLILAWKESGDLWNDMEFAVFFDSFRPWTN